MELAQAIGFKGNPNDDAASYLVDRINDLKKQMGIAANLRDHGITEDACLAELQLS